MKLLEEFTTFSTREEENTLVKNKFLEHHSRTLKLIFQSLNHLDSLNISEQKLQEELFLNVSSIIGTSSRMIHLPLAQKLTKLLWLSEKERVSRMLCHVLMISLTSFKQLSLFKKKQVQFI
jgi:hypothetical protein